MRFSTVQPRPGTRQFAPSACSIHPVHVCNSPSFPFPACPQAFIFASKFKMVMKHVILSLVMLGFLNTIQVQAQSDKIAGLWFNEDKSNKVEIYKAGETYSGKVVWIAKLENNPGLQLKDKNNPKPELRSRDILGMDIITGLKYSGGKWVNGTIYSPKKGIYADCKAEVLSDGRLKLTVTKSGITRTQIWTR
jgi:uncharacterized protein (DUF2147 family)